MPRQWTADERAEICRLWTEGWSARQIGATYHVSRCAILGLVHRARLGRTSAADKLRRVPQAPAPRPRRAAKRPPLVQPGRMAPSPAATGTVALADVGPGRCRYPLADPAGLATLLCGAASGQGSSYCGPHHARCYLTAPSLAHVQQMGTLTARRQSVSLLEREA